MALPQNRQVIFDLGRVERLDTAGAWLVLRTEHALETRGNTVEIANLRPSLKPLLEQVQETGHVEPLPHPVPPHHTFVGFVARIGEITLRLLHRGYQILGFFGVISIALARLLIHPGRLRRTATLVQMERTGVDAMPITGLLSFLVGVVIAYQGADQLRKFGAEVYNVNLLGVGVLRELGVLMASIVIAGRSGSAFTAEIGTMEVNEEIDALRTLGLDPIEVLVLPRLLGLVLTLPLLVFFVDFMGLLGGAIMCWAALERHAGDVPAPAPVGSHPAGRCGSGSSRHRSLPRSSRSSAVMKGFNVTRRRRERRPSDDAVGGRGDLPGDRRRRGVFDRFLAAGDLSVADDMWPIRSSACTGWSTGSGRADDPCHDGVDLEVEHGEVIGIVGGSGTGKSVLLRTIVGLNHPAEGSIEVLGHDMLHADEGERRAIEQRWGVLFQDGALFSSLTVAQNIEVPIKEHCRMPTRLMDEIAACKVGLVRLPESAADKFPSQLSGGMRKRGPACARALALDPEQSCFSTSRPPGSTRSRRPISTSLIERPAGRASG